jgi:HPt (histidine-containing phosphotransfer) domain-containing protein
MSFDHVHNVRGPMPSVVISQTNVAVDMELLNAFEELQSDDGSDLIVELIDLYLEDAPRRILAIREAAVATEWVLLKRAAHNLKGSSANLGICLVAEICRQLEDIDSDYSAKTLGELLQQIDYEFARANEVLLSERQRRLQ